MLETSGLSTKFLKKETFSGSHHGMRYTIKKTEDGLVVYVYAEPWAFESTSAEDRLTKEFAFSDDGVKEAITWLEDFYTSNRKFWDNASKNKMANMLNGIHLGVPK